MSKIIPAPDVETVAREIIREHHPDLANVRIVYAFRLGKWMSQGAMVHGNCIKVSGNAAFLASLSYPRDEQGDHELYLILISQPYWINLNDAERRALVDHELCHCSVDYDEDGSEKLSIRAHDVEEFREIIERHGLDSRPASIRQFVQTAMALKD